MGQGTAVLHEDSEALSESDTSPGPGCWLALPVDNGWMRSFAPAVPLLCWEAVGTLAGWCEQRVLEGRGMQ